MTKLKKNFFLIAAVSPAFIYLLGFFIIIVFYLLNMSLAVYKNGIPIDTSLQNYLNLAASQEFNSALVRTIVFVSVVTPLQLFTGILTAMLINKGFKGRGVIRSVFMLPLAIPTIVTTSILLIMFSKGGHVPSLLAGEYSWFPKVFESQQSFLNNEVLALSVAIFGKVWRDTPISMLIILSGLQSIPGDQYEAARTMGSSKIQNFFFITLPLLVPAISSVLVLRSIEAFKEFIFPYILAPSFPILGVLIDKYYVQLFDPGTASAIAVVLIVLILISSVILKQIVTAVNNILVKV